jgi:hypothetical protein
MSQTTETDRLILAGSYSDICHFIDKSNLDDLEQLITPCDMRSEIEQALKKGSEVVVLFASNEGTDYCFLPNAQRGGVCTNSCTEWTDCVDMDDLEMRWVNFDEKWSN